MAADGACRGRLRGGRECALDGMWVGANFKASFLDKVLHEGGEFVHVPVGNAQERPPPAGLVDHRDGPEVLSAQGATANPVAQCPAIAYRQRGADFCAAYGLASALAHYGDAAAAEAIAASAAAALASGDAFAHVRGVMRRQAAGWLGIGAARARASCARNNVEYTPGPAPCCGSLISPR